MAEITDLGTEAKEDAGSSSKDVRTEVLCDSEQRARNQALRNPLALFFVNGYAALRIFAIHFLLTPETAFGCALTVSATLASYYATQDAAARDEYNARSMSWILLSLAVVMPMSFSVKAAFDRRECALRSIEMVRSKSYELYVAHALWDWGCGDANKGRDRSDGDDRREHGDKVLRELLGVGDDLHRVLTLPTWTRARHRVTSLGRKEAARVASFSYSLYNTIFSSRMIRLTLLAEDLKREGLKLPEAIRIRQWERLICDSVEDLRMIKSYRTPQGLRAFARIFTLVLPPFYSLYFAQVAHDTDSLGLALCFGLIVSLALTALFEANNILEDPFIAHLTMDGIDVHNELVLLQRQELLGARNECFPDAQPFEAE